MDEYKRQVELSKENIRKSEEMLKKFEKQEQRKFEEAVLRDTENFWLCK